MVAGVGEKACMPTASAVSVVVWCCTRRGISFNQYFGDFSNYTNAWLHQHLLEGEDAHPGLALSVESWRRQRQYIEWALEVRHHCSQAARVSPPLIAGDVFVCVLSDLSSTSLHVCSVLHWSSHCGCHHAWPRVGGG